MGRHETVSPEHGVRIGRVDIGGGKHQGVKGYYGWVAISPAGALGLGAPEWSRPENGRARGPLIEPRSPKRFGPASGFTS
jgi:hypothetical protein